MGQRMPTHTITYNLPEEEGELRRVIGCPHAYSALAAIRQILRNHDKVEFTLQSAQRALVTIRDVITEAELESGVEL